MKNIILSLALTLVTFTNVCAKEPFTTHKVIEYYNKALIEENETALSRLKYFIEVFVIIKSNLFYISSSFLFYSMVNISWLNFCHIFQK